MNGSNGRRDKAGADAITNVDVPPDAEVLSGGRVLLDRVSGNDDEVIYVAVLRTADSQHELEIRVDRRTGEVHIDTPPDESLDAPAYLVAAASAFVRSIAQTHRGEPWTMWPRRVHRWRPQR